MQLGFMLFSVGPLIVPPAEEEEDQEDADDCNTRHPAAEGSPVELEQGVRVSALINNSVVVGLLSGSGLDGRGFGSSPTHVVAELVSGDAPGDVEGECRRAPPATQQAETILFRRTR